MALKGLNSHLLNILCELSPAVFISLLAVIGTVLYQYVNTIANRLEPGSGPANVGLDLGSILFAFRTILFF